MATIGPYDQVSFANYTPMSSQEILMPALMMREKHDKLEEEYSQIDDELNKVAFIAETEDNPILKQRYSNYMNSLVQNRDKLMTQGITSNSRKDMLGLRSKFQSEIQPINLGYQMKLKDIEAFNQKKMQDSSFIGPDPSQRSVMDYINNGLQPFTMQGVSGNEIAKQTAEMAQQYSQLAKTREGRQLLEDQFGFQYQEHWVDRGFIPGSPEAKQFEDHIKQSVLASNQINWANEEQMKLIDNSIQRGMSALIGKSDVNTLKDAGRDFRMQQALIRAGQETPSNIPGFSVQPGDVYNRDKRTQTIKEKNASLLDYYNTGNIGILDRGNPTTMKIYKDTKEMYDKFKHKSVEEINNYFNDPKNKIEIIKAINSDVGMSSPKKDITQQVLEGVLALKEINNFDTTNETIASSLGISKHDAEKLTESYLDKTATMAEAIYSSGSESIRRGEELSLETTKHGMFNNRHSQVFIDGESKSMDDIDPTLRSKIMKESTILGHNKYDPKVGMPTAIFSYIPEKGEKLEGKEIRIKVPDANLSDKYYNTNVILNALRDSNTFTGKEINLRAVNEEGRIANKKFILESAYINNRWEQFIRDGENITPIETIIDKDINAVKNDYYNRSLTPAQTKYTK